MQVNPQTSGISSAANQFKTASKLAEQDYDQAYDYYIDGNWTCAERCVKRALLVDPFDTRYRLLLAQVYCARGWLMLAQTELQTLKIHEPDNSGAKALEMLLKTKISENKRIDFSKRLAPQGNWSAKLKRAIFWLN